MNVENKHEYQKLDYCLIPILNTIQYVPGYKALLAGERYFLYQMLKLAYARTENIDRTLNLFYRYIVIKERIWDELIQTNGTIGFDNFLRYQNRKEEFIENTIYEKYFLQLAVAGTLTSQNIKRLEARIVPKDTAVKNRKNIIEQRNNILEALKEEFPNEEEKISEYMDSLFYVYHFIKEKDKSLESVTEDLMLKCRHYKKRMEVYKQSIAITKMREQYYESAQHVYGIDAASEEIVCRPEVFAHAFRYLKNHIVRDSYDFGEINKGLPNLKITYHAGEDFLDVIDGLRAIDEAIYFLDMQCGDRLGHALALGINVKSWYKLKNNKIVLSQQEYLDNLAWLYGKIRKFNIKGFEDVRMFIEKEFDEYMRIVYLNNIGESYLNNVIEKAREYYKEDSFRRDFARSGFNFDINAYYDAWKLRCDDPECYFTGFYIQTRSDSLWDDCAINRKYPANYKLRYSPVAAFLYHCYHYNVRVKQCGMERIEKNIPYNLVCCAEVVQKKMQELVAAKGICIECNPSSNHLIGTFNKYEEHPISIFYNKDLVTDPEMLSECAQLSVSINTDDQGVFYTSLENEYALIALSLEKMKDENGKPKYNRMQIFDWLDEVRKMGLIQSFKTI